MTRHNVNINDDPPYQDRYWRFQRIGWIGFGAVILAAVLGLFGAGPVAWSSAEGADFTLDYGRFARYGSSDSIVLRLGPGAGSATALVELDEEYLRSVSLQGISPEPVRQRLGASGAVFEFVREPGAPGQIVFNIQFASFGWIPGQIRLGDGTPVAFGHFVYP